MRQVVAVAPQMSDAHDAQLLQYGYARYIEAAGASALLLPLCDTAQQARETYSCLLSRVNGLIVPGGNDIDPTLYGQPRTNEADELVPQRDAAEPILVQLALEMRLPYFGICRGMQVANVVFGGTLCQKLGDGADDPHWQPAPFDRAFHEVRPEPGGLLASIVGDAPFGVNSLHHQGVDRLAPGLRVEASAPDGVIEALSRPGHPFFLAVQWHPERMPESHESQALMAAFVAACRV